MLNTQVDNIHAKEVSKDANVHAFIAGVEVAQQQVWQYSAMCVAVCVAVCCSGVAAKDANVQAVIAAVEVAQQQVKFLKSHQDFSYSHFRYSHFLSKLN